jgi:hypothetical protein
MLVLSGRRERDERFPGPRGFWAACNRRPRVRFASSSSYYPGVNGVTVIYQYQDSFLFRPDSTQNNGIWVTFAQNTWSWGGTAIFTGTGWVTGTPPSVRCSVR